MSGRSDLQLTSNISISDNNLSAGLSSSSVSESSGGSGGGGGMLGGFLGHVAGGVALPGEQFIFISLMKHFPKFILLMHVFLKKTLSVQTVQKSQYRLQSDWNVYYIGISRIGEKVSIIYWEIIVFFQAFTPAAASGITTTTTSVRTVTSAGAIRSMTWRCSSSNNSSNNYNSITSSNSNTLTAL